MNASNNDSSTVTVGNIPELTASNGELIRIQISSAIGAAHKNIDIDLSNTIFMDSCGLGILISVHRQMAGRNGRLRVLYPTPPVKQVLDLTQMHRLFTIVPATERLPNTPTQTFEKTE